MYIIARCASSLQPSPWRRRGILVARHGGRFMYVIDAI